MMTDLHKEQYSGPTSVFPGSLVGSHLLTYIALQWVLNVVQMDLIIISITIFIKSEI